MAPDQRGHGHSCHRGGFGREEFISDAAAFARALGAGPVAVLLLPGRLAREMLTRRPGTQLVEFADAGHWIHDDPDGSARVIAAFLGNRSAAPAS